MAAATEPNRRAGPHAGRFKSGQSGNPSGKAKGTRHKVTMALEKLLDGEAERITRAAIQLALEGDPAALRMCFDRILPARRDRHVTFTLPPIKTTADALGAANALLEAVAAGDLTPGEAAELGKLIDNCVRTLEVTELEERLSRLERMTNQ